MKASAVLKNARTELGNIIITNLRKLVGFEQTGKKNLMAEAGDMEIDTTKFAKTPYIDVEVLDTYGLDFETYADREVVTKIGIEMGDIYVVTDKDTYAESELSLENLARIADSIAEEYEAR